MPEKLQLEECPRDAMQGIHAFIPTENIVKEVDRVRAEEVAPVGRLIPFWHS